MDILHEIENAELVVNHFGYWPSFHDTEIYSIHLERNFEEGLPILLLKVYAFEITGQEKAVHLPHMGHCLIGLEFQGLVTNRLEGFNHQNAILELKFGIEGQLLTCQIDRAYCVSGFITAKHIKVKSLEKVNEIPERR